MKASKLDQRVAPREVKAHFKLYKSGKLWVTAGILATAIGTYAVTGTPVQAATTTTDADTSTADMIAKSHAAILRSSQTAAPTKADQAAKAAEDQPATDTATQGAGTAEAASTSATTTASAPTTQTPAATRKTSTPTQAAATNQATAQTNGSTATTGQATDEDVTTATYHNVNTKGEQIAPDQTQTITKTNGGVVPSAPTVEGYTLAKEVVNSPGAVDHDQSVNSIVIDYAQQTLTTYTGANGTGSVVKSLQVSSLSDKDKVALAYNGFNFDPRTAFDIEADKIGQFVSETAKHILVKDWWDQFVKLGGDHSYVYMTEEELKAAPTADGTLTAVFHAADSQGAQIAPDQTMTITKTGAGVVPSAPTVAGYTVSQEVVSNLPEWQDAGRQIGSFVMDYTTQTLKVYAGKDGQGELYRTLTFSELTTAEKVGLAYFGLNFDPSEPFDMAADQIAKFDSPEAKNDFVYDWWRQVIAAGGEFTYVYQPAADGTTPPASDGSVRADFTYVDEAGNTVAPTKTFTASATHIDIVPSAVQVAGRTLEKEVINGQFEGFDDSVIGSIIVDYTRQTLTTYTGANSTGTLLKAIAFSEMTVNDKVGFAYNGILIDPDQPFDIMADTVANIGSEAVKVDRTIDWWQEFNAVGGTHAFVYTAVGEAPTTDLVSEDKVRAAFTYVDEAGQTIAPSQTLTTTTWQAGVIPGAVTVTGYTLQKEVVNTPQLNDGANVQGAVANSYVVDYGQQTLTVYRGLNGTGAIIKSIAFGAIDLNDRIALAYNGIMIDPTQPSFDMAADTIGHFVSPEAKLILSFNWWRNFVLQKGTHTFVYTKDPETVTHGTTTSTRTIVFVDEAGNSLADPITQTVTYRTSTNGEGETVYTAQGVYSPEAAPTIAGYTPDQSLIAADYPGTGIGTPQDTVVTVTYTKTQFVTGEVSDGPIKQTMIPEGLSVTAADYYNNLTPGEVAGGVQVKTQSPDALSVTPEDYYDYLPATPVGQLSDGLITKMQIPAGVSVTAADYYNNLTPGEVAGGVQVKTQIPAGVSVTAADYYNNLTPGEVAGGVVVQTMIPAGLSVTATDYYDHRTPTTDRGETKTPGQPSRLGGDQTTSTQTPTQPKLAVTVSEGETSTPQAGATTQASAATAHLPQTGDAMNAALALSGLGVMALMGLAGATRRKHDEAK
ncbi:KxYKxGKxW signal peptide domain-containing protein [Lacticaseibacillus absianus]|uniref:KxYKxGKxW signal peptide domain-containing protein n=1 Tax=Lacticaseibacillus absianus TaxID=2729623 RepID=UPI0015C969D9|nr:KxYKxGKxW signal peptide domain-containing protein [Lacticaseibacillus absianus]